MSRAISTSNLRAHAITNLKAAIALALDKADHISVAQMSYRLEQMATRMERQRLERQKARAVKGMALSHSAIPSRGLHVGRSAASTRGNVGQRESTHADTANANAPLAAEVL